MRRFALALALVLVGSVAQASITAVKVDRSNNAAAANKPANTVTNSVKIDSSSNVSGQQMRVTLTAGTIFQVAAPFGGNTPPSQDFVSFSPSLPWDTFVAMGGDRAGTSAAILEVGGAVNILPANATKLFDTSAINITYSPATGVNTGPVSNYLIGQITLSSDAQGTWSYYGTGATGSPLATSLPIINGFIIPEPSTVALCGLGLVGLVGLARRRS